MNTSLHKQLSTTPLSNQAPLYVIVYDVSDNKERTKVDKVLHDYGFRVQKSVYECRLTRSSKTRLIKTLTALDIQTGGVRMYSVGSQKIVKIGQVEPDFDDEFIYFIE